MRTAFLFSKAFLKIQSQNSIAIKLVCLNFQTLFKMTNIFQRIYEINSSKSSWRLKAKVIRLWTVSDFNRNTLPFFCRNSPCHTPNFDHFSMFLPILFVFLKSGIFVVSYEISTERYFKIPHFGGISYYA